ncbi:hypothetical protein POTOM_037366 [Populus tomentosa]|uniref:Uncharacterized protein n=1 Tax=Populus tomentosa TaxID=118781 RepID=A0A8X7YVP0_POPTO|nr:hypothetical protein POTOM_037366 [Populus tomentosa]
MRSCKLWPTKKFLCLLRPGKLPSVYAYYGDEVAKGNGLNCDRNRFGQPGGFLLVMWLTSVAYHIVASGWIFVSHGTLLSSDYDEDGYLAN